MATRVRACVFDAYGTLFDVHSAVAAHADRVGAQADAVSRLWRTKQLEYTWTLSLMGRHADFRVLTERSLDFALAAYGIRDDGLRPLLLAAYQRLTAYGEVKTVLERLRAAGFDTAILSNGTPDWLAAAVDSAGLNGLLDPVLSIEEVGIYKPDPRIYALAADRLGLENPEICFLSSNAWDLAGALAFGFRGVWINRTGQPAEYGFADTVPVLRDLTGLPALLAG